MTADGLIGNLDKAAMLTGLQNVTMPTAQQLRVKRPQVCLLCYYYRCCIMLVVRGCGQDSSRTSRTLQASAIQALDLCLQIRQLLITRTKPPTQAPGAPGTPSPTPVMFPSSSLAACHRPLKPCLFVRLQYQWVDLEVLMSGEFSLVATWRCPSELGNLFGSDMQLVPTMSH